ncbi:SulP family inorganic anion transporter [Novosphingobium aquae]|jgi:SulP family sulfate permease|uniref:SulP family inorganic anion transporter n=1 Tax=Novosphingobium aquae TaxID=3133435 RepID=A0ABU8S8J9_9SPHN
MKPKLLTTLRGYTSSQFRADVLAGITVALIAIPLSLAIAIASGANPAAGLVSAIIGGFLISLLGGSKVQIGGPTGAFIVVVYGVIAAHGFAGLILATLMAGVILVLAGLLRLGNLIEHVPEPVVNGFTIGIAVIIASSQLKDLLGLDIQVVPAEFLPKIAALWSARATLDTAALGTGLIALALIIALRRLFPKLPGLIFAMAAVSLGVAVMHLPVETITSRFGTLPSHIPAPVVPEISLALLRELLPSALVIAFLAAIESLLSAMVADRMIEGSHRPNAEVMAQGWANIAASLFGGLPVTGAIARTATNVRAGGQTPVAGLVHAAVIFLIMLVAAPYAGYLAMPALAAILLTTAWNMSEPHRWPQYWAAPMADRVLLLLTMVLTVLADLTTAIGVGVALGLALRLREKGLPPAPWSGRQ